MDLTSWTLADQDCFPCMSERIYVGNTFYPIRYICDVLHKKILFKLNQRLFPGEAIFGRLSEIFLFCIFLEGCGITEPLDPLMLDNDIKYNNDICVAYLTLMSI